MAWLDDAALLPRERRWLQQFLTPRRALDGRLVWPTAEAVGLRYREKRA